MRQIFDDSLQAREWEHKVLRRLDAIHNEKWLNKGLGKAIPPMLGSDNPMSGLGQSHPLIGRKQSIETSEKKRKRMKGKNTGPQTVDTIKNRVAKNTGQKRTIEQRKNLSDSMKGIPKSEEHKKKLSEIRKGLIRCYDLREHKNVTISKNIYYSVLDIYCHHNSKICKEDKRRVDILESLCYNNVII